MFTPTQHQESRIVNRYLAGASLSALAREHGTYKEAIGDLLARRGVEKRPQNLMSPEDVREAERLYRSGLTIEEVAGRLGRSHYGIWTNLHRAGAAVRTTSEVKRKYPVRDDYFAVIDSDEKAYWLGFLAADGSVSSRHNAVRIGLARCDEGHLAKFRDAVSPTAPIWETESRLHGRRFPGSLVQVVSARMCADLARHGVTPAKSLTLRPWGGPRDLLPAYYRGLVDGDGTWEFRAARRRMLPSLSLLATVTVATAFRDAVCQWTGAPPNVITPFRATAGLGISRFSSLPVVQAAARVMFSGATVWLDRKKVIVDQLLAATPGPLCRPLPATVPQQHL
jgi:hypothetical protein